MTPSFLFIVRTDGGVAALGPLVLEGGKAPFADKVNSCFVHKLLFVSAQKVKYVSFFLCK